jgi:predicted nucleotide-binding protein/predicted ester cyclase
MHRWLITLSILLGTSLIGLGRVAPSIASQDATPASRSTACPTTTPDENKALVREYWETVYNGKDPSRVPDFLGEDFVRLDPGVPQADQLGIADDVIRTEAQLADFPDLLVSVDDLVAEGDEVVARLTWRGTQLDPLEPWGAPATGRPAEFMAISIVRIECGRFAEEWALFDDLTMLRQLGIITDEELVTAGSAASEITADVASPVVAATAPAQSGRPRVFIASSVEGLPVAEAIEVDLQFFADVTIWEQGAFHPSQGSLAAIDEAADQSDFAIAVLTPDDMTTKRGQSYAVPRDNVIFELGFFMGRLGIERTFMLYSRDNPPTLPSDLQGVTAVTYAERMDGNLEAAVGPAAIQIREAMQAVIAAEGVSPNRE